MSTHVQKPPTSRQNSSSRVAFVVFSTVTVAVLTAYSYFQWSCQSSRITPTVSQKTENSKDKIREDDHQSDSESAEIDETPPSSPAPRIETFDDDPEEDLDELVFDPKRIAEVIPAEKIVHPIQTVPCHSDKERAVREVNECKDHEDVERSAVEDEKPALYREDAIRIFKGFVRNQRSKKGISLTTACLVYKEAWSINKNPRDMILPGRVLSHFKQTLPSKLD